MSFPKIGIRPVIDGRSTVRATLEDQTMNMAISECFDAGLRTLCSELCIPCIDGMTLTPAVPAARFTDGIHFSDLGGVTAAQSLYAILQNA